MKDRGKKFSGEFKTKVALEAIKGHRTVSEIAGEYGVHPHPITQWKKQVLDDLPDVLSDKRQKRKDDHKELVSELCQQIGQLKAELDWLKKSLDLPLEGKRRLIEPDHPVVSVARQCELLGLSRSSWYYKPREVSSIDLEMMHLIDEQYTRTPFYGVRRMTASLNRQGHRVNRKRVQRLMGFMGLEAICPRPKLRAKDEHHKVDWVGVRERERLDYRGKVLQQVLSTEVAVSS